MASHIDATTLDILRRKILPIFNRQYQATIAGKKFSREEAENFQKTATGLLGGSEMFGFDLIKAPLTSV